MAKRAIEDYKNGKFGRPLITRKSGDATTRKTDAMRARLARPIDGDAAAAYKELDSYCCRVSDELGGRVPTFVSAASLKQISKALPAVLRAKELNERAARVRVCAFMKKINLKLRLPSKVYTHSFREAVCRCGASWRNCIRFHAYYHPVTAHHDAMGHTPAQRLAASGSQVAARSGAESIAIREDAGASQNKLTWGHLLRKRQQKGQGGGTFRGKTRRKDAQLR